MYGKLKTAAGRFTVSVVVVFIAGSSQSRHDLLVHRIREPRDERKRNAVRLELAPPTSFLRLPDHDFHSHTGIGAWNVDDIMNLALGGPGGRIGRLRPRRRRLHRI